jgi:hypothetical protein
MSPSYINFLDFRENHINLDGFLKIITWIVSWTETEFVREDEPLRIDLRFNQVSDTLL